MVAKHFSRALSFRAGCCFTLTYVQGSPCLQNVAAEHIFLLRCGQDEFVAHNPFPTSSGHLLKLYRQMHRHPPRWDDSVQGWVFQMAGHDELMRVLLKAPSSQHSEPAAESKTVPALLQQGDHA